MRYLTNIRQYLFRLTIKRKLILIILSVAVFGIVTVSGIYLILENRSMRQDIVNKTSVIASIMAEYCVIPLAFNQDREGTEIILSRLRTFPFIEDGYVYNVAGELFAGYCIHDHEHLLSSDDKSKAARELSPMHIRVNQPIEYQGERFGTISLIANTSLLQGRIVRLFGVSGLIIILILLFSYLLANELQRLFLRPIYKLVDVVKQITDFSDFSVRIDKYSEDEIGTLYDGFNEMMARIEKREEERKKNREELQSTIAELTASQEAALNLAENLSLEIKEKKDAEQKIKEYSENLEKMVDERTLELKEKTERLVESQNAMTFLIKDINKSREELMDANRNLDSVNRELNEFAYIVSHDLKAPLRALSQLSWWLAEDYKDVIDAEGQEKLNLLIGRVQRMNNLIEGILEYSRIGRMNDKREPIQLKELLESVLHDLQPPSSIEFKLASEFPTVVFNPVRIQQVFQNLISNAVKFMDKSEGEICLDWQDKGNEWEFSVSDNGPGIEKKHVDRIFKIFQTLVPRDTVESTGIGLALVKKIIDLYKGSIRVHSEVGFGSTFYITLPKADVQSREADGVNKTISTVQPEDQEISIRNREKQ